MGNPKDAFVIMPFSGTATCTESQWTEIYDNVFRPAFEGCGYSCERAMPMTGSLAASIIDRLRCARIVLADLTDRNPNVFYELGIRHCLKKGTILAAQGAHHIPSDLTGYWFVDYATSPGAVTRFKAEIKRLATMIDAEPEKSDNPVPDYLDKEHINIQGHLRRDAIKKLGALFTELTGLNNILAEMPANPELARFLSSDCLELLCHTMYIDVGPTLLSSAYELVYRLTQLRQDAGNSALLVETQLAVRGLSAEVQKLREMLLRGEYNEPPVVSTMVWVPASPKPSSVSSFLCEFASLAAAQNESCVALESCVSRSVERSALKTVLAEACHSFSGSMGTIYLADRSPDPHGSSTHLWTFNDKKALIPPKLPIDKAGRNKPCPCGSGRKYKNCCGRG